MPAPRVTRTALAPLAEPLAEVPVADAAAVDAEAVTVPFCAFAAAWNAPKLFGPVSIALTLKTIPEPQWLACLQYAHIGAVEFTVMLNVGKIVSVSETGWKPESKPTWPLVDVDVRLRQGVAKLDCDKQKVRE